MTEERVKKLILNFGHGTLQDGCSTVIAELIDVDRRSMKCSASLPPCPSLAYVHRQWQQLYRDRYRNQLMRIKLLDDQGLRYSEQDFQQSCIALKAQLNQWLRSDSFQLLTQSLRTELSRHDHIQVILEMNDPQLQILPWHLWEWFEDYPYAEVAISALDWRELPMVPTRSLQTRILLLLGDSQGIDVQTDRQLLSQLPQAEVVVLEEPTQAELSDVLWDPQGWDIVFFAGHSETTNATGTIYLNATDNLTIPQLKQSLAKAIAQGLKVVFFNSCDGLGLAQQLADLQIPYITVMREPIPDEAAQLFLKSFLKAFSQGAYFHVAVREARQRLEGLEGTLPCASWLPLVWQNPTAPPLRWPSLSQPSPHNSPSPILPKTTSPSIEPSQLRGDTGRPRVSQPSLSPKTIALTVIAMTTVVMGGRILGVLEPLEMAAYDHLMRQRPEEVVDPRILMVEISQADTDQYGYPLEDETLVQLIRTLGRYQPNAIGLDIHRAQTPLKAADTNSGYQQLLTEFHQRQNLFMVCSYSNTDKSYDPPPVSSEEQLWNQVGFSDLLLDGNRPRLVSDRSDLDVDTNAVPEELMVRRQLLSYDPNLIPEGSGCATPYSLSFQLAFQFFSHLQIEPLEVNNNNHWQFGPVTFLPLPKRFGGYQSLDGKSSQIPLNYRANQPGQRVTLTQVLRGQIDPNSIQDRVVLVGYTSPVARDYFVTPYGPMAGVWIHAHMVSQLVSAVLDQRPLIHTLPHTQDWAWGDILWVLTCVGTTGGVTGYIVTRKTFLERRFRTVFRILGILLSSEILVLYYISQMAFSIGLWLPLVPSLLGVIVTIVALSIFSAHSQRRFLQTISPQHHLKKSLS